MLANYANLIEHYSNIRTM